MNKLLYLLIFSLIFQLNLFGQENPITIFMIGNSTMANKAFRGGHPETGWGQTLPLYFKEGIIIDNHAMNGRSTKSFIDEGRWEVVLNKVNPGDYVIIEFGHNDSKKEDPKKFADANTDYRFNLLKFVNETRVKGGIPILATPIVRRRFNKEAIFYDVHGDYPKVVREIAADQNVILLDLHKSTEALLIKYGEERSKQLFLHILPGEYDSLPDGLKDDTHLSPSGAFKVCDLAILEIKEKIKQLVPFIKE